MKKIMLFAAVLIQILLVGCASVEEDSESQLPWTETEPWEQQFGSMPIQ